MPFNTVFQLFSLAQSNSPLLEMAETLLMMPDVLNWLLTGQRACERTDASTTQLLDPTRGAWSDEICASLGIPRHILGDFVEPGTSLGPLHGRLAEETGLDPATTVYATAGHDTAAAVAAVPAKSRGANGPDWCYISSGTWSLMGVESPKPIINKATFDANFTNEGGVLGTTRILKNIMGLWLVQECRRAWERAGREFSYEDLTNRASAAEPFAAFVDPDDSTFLEPGDMPARLLAYCGRTGQRAPADEGGLVRCALESLAFKYRYVLDRLESIVGNRLETIHIVGGGTRNTLLCQFTADACGRPVLAGPIEATAMGNILMQLVGTRKVGSLADGREIVARSFPVTPYEPTDVGRWDHAYGRFLSVTGLNLK
jgi:rhamnulokinase